MLIRGYDYKFAYTVGAYLAISDLGFTATTKKSEQTKQVLRMAVIMSKAYEDREHLDNPEHKPTYLTMDMLNTLTVGDIAQLSKEVDDAFKAGGERTVKTKKDGPSEE